MTDTVLESPTWISTASLKSVSCALAILAGLLDFSSSLSSLILLSSAVFSTAFGSSAAASLSTEVEPSVAPIALSSSSAAVVAASPDTSLLSSPFSTGAGSSGSVPCGSAPGSSPVGTSGVISGAGSGSTASPVVSGSASTVAAAAVSDAPAFSAARVGMLIGMHAETVMIADIRIAVICFLFIIASLLLFVHHEH